MTSDPRWGRRGRAGSSGTAGGSGSRPCYLGNRYGGVSGEYTCMRVYRSQSVYLPPRLSFEFVDESSENTKENH